MNTGDFVLVDYVARIKDSGEVFDLTNEEFAKKENIHDAKFKYGPVPIIVDANFIIKGLNNIVKEMKVGEKRKFAIKPEDAFGERNPDMIKLIPQSFFKDQDLKVMPGKYVKIRDLSGKVLSADGGRVKIDFNHPLAGKTLEYDLEVLGEIKNIDEKVKAVIYYFASIEKDDLQVEVKEKTVEIIFKKRFNILAETKELIASNITKWVGGIEVVRFVDVFEKKQT